MNLADLIYNFCPGRGKYINDQRNFESPSSLTLLYITLFTLRLSETDTIVLWLIEPVLSVSRARSYSTPFVWGGGGGGGGADGRNASSSFSPQMQGERTCDDCDFILLPSFSFNTRRGLALEGANVAFCFSGNGHTTIVFCTGGFCNGTKIVRVFPCAEYSHVCPSPCAIFLNSYRWRSHFTLLLCGTKNIMDQLFRRTLLFKKTIVHIGTAHLIWPMICEHWANNYVKNGDPFSSCFFFYFFVCLLWVSRIFTYLLLVTIVAIFILCFLFSLLIADFTFIWSFTLVFEFSDVLSNTPYIYNLV